MEVKTEIDRQKRVRKHIITGSISFSKLRSYLLKFYEDPELNNSFNSIWDLSQATGFENLTGDDVRDIALLVNSKWYSASRVKSALVVSKKLDYGLARMFEIQLSAVSTNDIRVFKDIKEATEWINGD